MKTVLCGWSPVTAGFPISPCDANGEAERAVDVASYAFIGDFNDTSKYGGCLPARHYGNRHGRTLLAASLHEYMHQPEVEPRQLARFRDIDNYPVT